MYNILKCRSVAHTLAGSASSEPSEGVLFPEDSTYNIANVIFDYTTHAKFATGDAYETLKKLLEGKRDYFLQ